MKVAHYSFASFVFALPVDGTQRCVHQILSSTVGSSPLKLYIMKHTTMSWDRFIEHKIAEASVMNSTAISAYILRFSLPEVLIWSFGNVDRHYSTFPLIDARAIPYRCASEFPVYSHKGFKLASPVNVLLRGVATEQIFLFPV
jgi:hypothetical protein